MNNNLHVLGRLRWPIVLLLTVVMTVVLHNILLQNVYSDDLKSSAIWLRMGITCLGVFLFLRIITTELMIKVVIAFFPALAIGGIISVIAYFGIDAFFEGRGGQKEHLIVWSALSGGLALLIAWGRIYQRLDQSSWIGTRCPSCFVRGNLTSNEIGKEYIGTERSKDLSGIPNMGKSENKIYNKYFITTLHECSSCGHSWQTTSESRERA